MYTYEGCHLCFGIWKLLCYNPATDNFMVKFAIWMLCYSECLIHERQLHLRQERELYRVD